MRDSVKRNRLVSHRADMPTYTTDITGAIKRWDQRDSVFSRSDLFYAFGTEHPAYIEYYRNHPELEVIDGRINHMPGLGHTGGVDVPMFAAQFAATRWLNTPEIVDGPPASRQTRITPECAALKVKSMARFLGADLVGIGPLRQDWVYSNIGRPKSGPYGQPINLDHPTAIALGFAMDYDLIQHAPDFPVLLATAKGYGTGSWISVQLAHYIRQMGFRARAHHVDNYQVLCVPVAVDCGLGELSRAGFLISREYGLGLRLAVVTTDIPLEYDSPVDIGVQSFCEQCKICAEQCPSGAIASGEKTTVNGIKRWKLDAESCYSYWHAVGTDCAICMTSCPWTQKRNLFHRLVSQLASIPGKHQMLLTWAHKLVYGQHRSKARPDFIDDDPRWHHLLRGRRR